MKTMRLPYNKGGSKVEAAPRVSEYAVQTLAATAMHADAVDKGVTLLQKSAWAENPGAVLQFTAPRHNVELTTNLGQVASEAVDAPRAA